MRAIDPREERTAHGENGGGGEDQAREDMNQPPHGSEPTGKNGVMENMEEWERMELLASLPMFPPAITALNNSAITTPPTTKPRH